LKLLLDQNLSRKLVPAIDVLFPGTSHVAYLGLERSDDAAIRRYAQENGFVLATKNTDMVDLCIVKGAPPKIVWLRVGNCPTAVIRDLLGRNEERIRQFEAEEERVVLSLFRFAAVE
jgi:predicted nuclease of predicted toxin-antitoxin system